MKLAFCEKRMQWRLKCGIGPEADEITRKSEAYKYDVPRCIRREAKSKTKDAAWVKRMMRGAMDTKTTAVELPPVTVVQQVSLQYL